jgi:hypothetical protein
MVDNVVFSTGQLVVATKGDNSDIQHQKVVDEFLTGGGLPQPVSTISPMPMESPLIVDLLTQILIELRVQNELKYQQVYPEVEPLETLRLKYTP